MLGARCRRRWIGLVTTLQPDAAVSEGTGPVVEPAPIAAARARPRCQVGTETNLSGGYRTLAGVSDALGEGVQSITDLVQLTVEQVSVDLGRHGDRGVSHRLLDVPTKGS
jgi:hypothetical protein